MSMKDFSIIAKLEGEGAYSVVYKVRRESNNQIYALKKVKLSNLSEKEIENSVNEVRILASIKNKNIVGYKEVFLEGKDLCIIMEFLDDGDLYQKIIQHKKKKQLFQEKEIWSVLIQIIFGLKSLHQLNILHRDLKSANVFLNKDGVTKLGDLNVSKVAKNGLLYTQTGTPYYASPQVWKDAPYDTKSDIWSLGCVIYEMSTLRPPFQAQDMQGLFEAVIKGEYDPIDARYSKELCHIIKLMLQLKPKQRPSTQKIFKSSLIQKKIQQLSIELPITKQIKQQLLRTIRIPKNLHYLTDKLPRSNYDENQNEHHSYTLGHKSPQRLIASKVSQPRSNSKGSLPKIGQILKGNSKSPNIIAKKKVISNNKGDILMIQGKSKIIEDARNHEKNSKSLESEIKEELKRIYKVKDPKTDNKVVRKMDRILPPIRL